MALLSGQIPRRRPTRSCLQLCFAVILWLLGLLSCGKTAHPIPVTLYGEASNPGPVHFLDEPDDQVIEFESEDDMPPLVEDTDPWLDGEEDLIDITYASPSRPLHTCLPTKVGDWKLSDSQLERWQGLEHALGIKDSKPKASAKKRKVEPAAKLPTDLHPDYHAAKSFQGEWAGMAFKNGEHGMGYYADAKAATTTVITLDELIPEAASECHEPASTSVSVNALHAAIPLYNICSGPPSKAVGPSKKSSYGARQQYNKQGRRRRPKSRTVSQVSPLPAFSGDTLWGDNSWQKHGLWALDTCNPNHWSAAKDKALNRSAADIMCIQELKQSGKDCLDTIGSQARSLKWQCHASQAHAHSKFGASGGCAVAVRSGIGISSHTPHAISEQFQHRIKATHVSAILKGGVHIVSVYFCDSEGMSETNLEILAELACLLLSLVGPWIVAGDHNFTPAMLAATGWLQLVKGVTRAPDSPTCNGAVYDFFILSQAADQMHHSVLRISDSGLNPHFPARLLLKGNIRRISVRCLARPDYIPGNLPFGPLKENPEFNTIACESKNLSPEYVQEQTAKWLGLARLEWQQLTGKKPKDPELLKARFVWMPVAGPVALKDVGATMYSQCW